MGQASTSTPEGSSDSSRLVPASRRQDYSGDAASIHDGGAGELPPFPPAPGPPSNLVSPPQARDHPSSSNFATSPTGPDGDGADPTLRSPRGSSSPFKPKRSLGRGDDGVNAKRVRTVSTGSIDFDELDAFIQLNDSRANNSGVYLSSRPLNLEEIQEDLNTLAENVRHYLGRRFSNIEAGRKAIVQRIYQERLNSITASRNIRHLSAQESTAWKEKLESSCTLDETLAHQDYVEEIDSINSYFDGIRDNIHDLLNKINEIDSLVPMPGDSTHMTIRIEKDRPDVSRQFMQFLPYRAFMDSGNMYLTGGLWVIHPAPSG
jgi:hypothetical protein